MDNIKINGLKLYGFSSRDELIEFAANRKKSLIAVNAEKILQSSEQMRKLTDENIGYADGIGAVWALHKKGIKDAVKIPGCELWLDIISRFYKSSSFYLVGASEEVITQTVEKLKKEYNGINITGYRNGYFKTAMENQNLIDTIKKIKPDIVFVAMGSPRQELLINRLQQHHTAIYQGLGGSFDVYTGKAERAPEWLIKNSLEWAWRLVKEPLRIKRQIHLVKFLFLLLTGKI